MNADLSRGDRLLAPPPGYGGLGTFEANSHNQGLYMPVGRRRGRRNEPKQIGETTLLPMHPPRGFHDLISTYSGIIARSTNATRVASLSQVSSCTVAVKTRYLRQLARFRPDERRGETYRSKSKVVTEKLDLSSIIFKGRSRNRQRLCGLQCSVHNVGPQSLPTNPSAQSAGCQLTQ
jgi:hypothetical protein